MNLYDAFVLGGVIGYIKNIHAYKEEEIVKKRKKTKYFPLLDILRQINKDLNEYDINGATQEIISKVISFYPSNSYCITFVVTSLFKSIDFCSMSYYV